jgi:predicted nuclease of predicted toxin-antitoxin system
VRFLVDAQLPPALARLLSDAGHIAEHVVDVGLADAPDAAIWAFATLHGAIIITKDEDFPVQRASHRHRPTVVWLRVRNCSRQELIRWFMPLLPQIVGLIDAGEAVIELR